MTEYNYEQTLNLLNEVAKGKEKFVYKKVDGACVNWKLKKGKRVGDCIVGRVIEKIGHIDDVECWGSFDFARNTLANEDSGVFFTEKAATLLSYTQLFQDRGVPWGEAIREGIFEAENAEDVVYG